jgi:hypothetical protein
MDCVCRGAGRAGLSRLRTFAIWFSLGRVSDAITREVVDLNGQFVLDVVRLADQEIEPVIRRKSHGLHALPEAREILHVRVKRLAQRLRLRFGDRLD